MNPDEDKQNYWEESQIEEQELEQEAEQASSQLSEESDTTVTWTAQEYVHIDKSPVWFVLFVLVVLALITIDVFLLKSWTFSALVVVMAVAVIVYTRRPPRTLTYGLSTKHGLYVGEKQYRFDEFKAFGVIKDGEHHSVMLIPAKRFAPGVSVYFPEEAGERIVDILGQTLPMENLKLDIIDVLVRKLRL